MTGVRSLSMAGVRSLSMAGVRSLSMAGVRSLNMAGVRSLNMAGLRSLSMAGVRSLNKAGGPAPTRTSTPHTPPVRVTGPVTRTRPSHCPCCGPSHLCHSPVSSFAVTIRVTSVAAAIRVTRHLYGAEKVLRPVRRPGPRYHRHLPPHARNHRRMHARNRRHRQPWGAMWCSGGWSLWWCLLGRGAMGRGRPGRPRTMARPGRAARTAAARGRESGGP
jgi:hypothetical protein